MKPIADELRCEALIYDGVNRCCRRATRLRDGRAVCAVHVQAIVRTRYIDDGFDRVETYRATMARALGDDITLTEWKPPPALRLTAASAVTMTTGVG